MQRALELAEKAWGQTAPNPMVGAVVVNGDRVVGEGFHAGAGEAHAEVVALDQAGAHAKDATLYVTLAPCNHVGRTPPCSDAIIAAGISRVVVATADANPVSGGGIERLSAAGITVEVGVCQGQAVELNAAYFHRFGSWRPWVTLKLALTLDAAIAGSARRPGWFTGEAAREEVQRLRAGSDAIAVGIETVLADNPRLTVRRQPLPVRPPLRVVFDRSARLSAQSHLAKTAMDIPTLLVTGRTTALPSDLQRLGVQAMRAADLQDSLRQLRARGISSLMVEGGAGVAASFLAAACVDRLVLFQAPLILGKGSLGAFSGVAEHDLEHAPRFTLLSTRRLGDDLMTVYAPVAS